MGNTCTGVVFFSSQTKDEFEKSYNSQSPEGKSGYKAMFRESVNIVKAIKESNSSDYSFLNVNNETLTCSMTDTPLQGSTIEFLEAHYNLLANILDIPQPFPVNNDTTGTNTSSKDDHYSAVSVNDTTVTNISSKDDTTGTNTSSKDDHYSAVSVNDTTVTNISSKDDNYSTVSVNGTTDPNKSDDNKATTKNNTSFYVILTVVGLIALLTVVAFVYVVYTAVRKHQ